MAQSTTKGNTKMLGGQVEESLYWQFKLKAASRKESMTDAFTHAIMLYLEIDQENIKREQEV